MRSPPLLIALFIVACSKEEAPASIDQKIESALVERLAAARGSDEGVVLTDDTPRADVPEKPGEGSRLVFIRGASFQTRLQGLTGLSVAAYDSGLRVRLEYGPGAIEILDSSGAAAEREFERLRKVGERLWEEFWGGFEAQFGGQPGAAEPLERWLKQMPSWDANFARRFDSPLLLRRLALQASTGRLPDEIDEIYRNCRLLRVKREMIAAMGGGPEPAAYAIAAGPTIGIRRGVPGRDPEIRSAFYGPDGMTVRIVATGGLPEALVLEVMNSFRPFAESRSIAKRIIDRAREPIDAALAALSALHLEPSPDSAVQFLRSLKPLQEQRRELAEALAGWLKADGAKRDKIFAAAD